MADTQNKTSQSRYWFPAKRFGWGWGPPTVWQGWVVLIGFMAAIAAAGAFLMPVHLVAFLSFNLVMVILLLLICRAKGEPPAWRSGGRR